MADKIKVEAPEKSTEEGEGFSMQFAEKVAVEPPTKRCENEKDPLDSITAPSLQQQIECLRRQLEGWKELCVAAQALVKDKDVEIARLRSTGSAEGIVSPAARTVEDVPTFEGNKKKPVVEDITSAARIAESVPAAQGEPEKPVEGITSTALTGELLPAVKSDPEKPVEDITPTAPNAEPVPAAENKPTKAGKTGGNEPKPKKKQKKAKQELPDCVYIRSHTKKIELIAKTKSGMEQLSEYINLAQEICIFANDYECMLDPLYDEIMIAQLIKHMPPFVRMQYNQLVDKYPKDSLLELILWLDNVWRDAEHLQAQLSRQKKTPKWQCLACGKKKSVCRSLQDCTVFRKMSPAQRWDEVVHVHQLCNICLKKHKGTCTDKVPCGVGGCSTLHNWLLHIVGVHD